MKSMLNCVLVGKINNTLMHIYCSSVSAVGLKNGGGDTYSVAVGLLVVHLRYTRSANFALERHLVYGSGAFLVPHRPNISADLQNLCRKRIAMVVGAFCGQ